MSVTTADTLPRTRHPLLLPVLMGCATLTVMSGATIAPGMPGLERHFAEDGSDVATLVRLVLTVPGLAIALFAPFAGWLADRIGRRVLLMAGIVGYIAAGSAGLWLNDLTALLASRALLGVAVACVMTSSTALLTDHFVGPERDRAMGKQSAFMGVGGIVFVLLGSLLADLSWRGPFAVYLVPVVLLVLVPLYVSKPPENAIEPGAGGAMPKLHLALMCLIGFVSMLVFYNIPAQLPFYAEELGATSQATAGVAIVVGQIASVVASATFGRLRARAGHWTIMAVGFALIGVGYVALAYATNLTMLFATMPIIGFGLGLNFPNVTTWTMSRVPAEQRGRAAGALSSAVFLGQFASPLASQPIAAASSISTAYLVAGLFCLIACVVPALAMRRREAGRMSGQRPRSV